MRNQFRGARDLRVIPYGSERSRRPPGPALAGLDLEPGRYLLHVGRLVPENGALEVVRAHASIDEPRLPLVVVGGDPYETAYQRQVRASAGPGVLFAGFRYGAEYEELMTSAAGLVVAVTVGGTHPVVTEAMGFGLAVVAPDVPVMREVLGDAAVFFRPGGLAEAIARLPDPALGRRASRRAAERYSWDAVTSAYEEALAAAVRARTAG